MFTSTLLTLVVVRLRYAVDEPRARLRRPMTAACGLVAAYVAAVLVLTWPLGEQIATHLPRIGPGVQADTLYAGWALAWQTHALANAPTRFADANIYWPAPLALYYGTPGFGLLPVFAPVFVASGNPTLALNATMITNLGLTGAALHHVVRRWTASHAAGAAAAATFLVTRHTLLEIGYMPQYAALAPLPLIVAVVAASHLSGWRTLGLAALLAWQGLADAVYVAVPLFLTVGLAAWALACRPATRAKAVRMFVALAAAGLVLAPLYAAYVRVRLVNPGFRSQSVWTGGLGQVLPFLTSGIFPPRGPLAFDATVLVPAIAGLLLAAWRRGLGNGTTLVRWWWAGWWFGSGLALSWLLPRLVPAIRGFLATTVARDLLRLGFGGTIGLCLATGLGFACCAEALAGRGSPYRGRLVPAGLLLAFVALRCADAGWRPGRYPVAEAPRSGAELDVLRRARGPVLVLPTGSVHHAKAAYRSIAHWRPLVNGYSSYYPKGFKERMALAGRLPDPEALERLRRETGLATIVLHGAPYPNLVYEPWRAALRRGTLRGVTVVYDAADALVLDVGAPEAGR